MKITNVTKLPDVIVKAIESMIRPPDDSLHVTSLISPPIIQQLKQRHWAELEEDATANTWRLLGSAVHAVIEKNSPGHISEQFVEKVIDGVLVRGTADVKDGHDLYDYKVTSTWHKVFAGGLPKEWVQQLNIYACLFGGIKTIKVIVIYRDWQKSRALKDPDYPQQSLMAYDVPLMTPEDQEKLVKQRISLHRSVVELTDDQLPICSPEDRWATETKWAVYKNQNKTATRVLGSLEDAEKLAESLGEQFPKDKYRIEERPGVDKRCASYCVVKNHCRYYKENVLVKENA